MYSELAFVGWYVGRGMEAVRTGLPLRRIMRRLEWIMPRERMRVKSN